MVYRLFAPAVEADHVEIVERSRFQEPLVCLSALLVPRMLRMVDDDAVLEKQGKSIAEMVSEDTTGICLPTESRLCITPLLTLKVEMKMELL